MAAPVRFEVVKAEVGVDGQVVAEVRLSPALTTRVLFSEPAPGKEMVDAVQAVIAVRPKAASQRVTVMIEEKLAQKFAELCKVERTTVSRRLGGRIRHHLDQERNPDRRYVRKPIPEEYRIEAENGLHQVQISLSQGEARRFESFCKDHGVTKNGYVTGEMVGILHPKPKKVPDPRRARADAGTAGG